jgi:flagellar basal-body rod modification protein FlgD
VILMNVSSVSGSNGSNALSSALSSVTGSSGQFVSENTFLTLLITQLKNQDPMNPQDSSQFVAQLASFSSLEQMTAMSTSMNNVLDNSATSLIGQNVTLLNSSGNLVQGTVTGIVYYANTPAVQVNGVNYPMSDIQNVGNVVASATQG